MHYTNLLELHRTVAAAAAILLKYAYFHANEWPVLDVICASSTWRPIRITEIETISFLFFRN